MLLTGKLPTPGGIDEVGVDWERLHNYTKQVIVTLLKKSGFQIICTSSSGIFAKYRAWWSSLLSGDLIIKGRKL
jgi:hypothetical protein